MKKVVVSIVLGLALLFATRMASAEPGRGAEPRWAIRPERTAPPSPLDFAVWLARRLNETILLPVPATLVPTPESAPSTEPGPTEGEIVCPPDRVHCPVG